MTYPTVVMLVAVSLLIGVMGNEYDDLNLKLTGESFGPPPNAQFAPIPVIPFHSGRQRLRRPQHPFYPPPPPPRPTGGQMVAPPPTSAKPQSEGSTVAPPSPPMSTLPPPPPPPPPPPGPPPVPTPVSHAVTTSSLNVSTSLPTPPPVSKPYPPSGYSTSQTEQNQNDTLIYSVSTQDDDSYFFDFLVANSVRRQEQGYFKKGKNENETIHVKTGFYSFTSPEGKTFKVNYVADENGYRTYQTLS